MLTRCCLLCVQSPSDVMDFGMVAEVLDAEDGVPAEGLFVHAPNPVSPCHKGSPTV
jgi:hypothetical protein